MKMKHDRVRRAGIESVVKHRRLLLQEAIPAAHFSLGIFLGSPQSLEHEIVVVGGQIDREIQIRQKPMNLAWVGEIRANSSLYPLRDPLLRQYAILLHDSDELRHAGQVFAVAQRIPIFDS